MVPSPEQIYEFDLGELASFSQQRYDCYVGIPRLDGSTPRDEAAIFANRIRSFLDRNPDTPEAVIRSIMLENPAPGAGPIIEEAISRVFPQNQQR